MSLDQSVWSANEINLAELLPESDHWNRRGDDFAFETDSWQVLVQMEENEPEGVVLTVLPTASYVYYVTLEPIHADTKGQRFFEDVVRMIARISEGVWIDQSGVPYQHDDGSF